jgi:hypothetical protein
MMSQYGSVSAKSLILPSPPTPLPRGAGGDGGVRANRTVLNDVLYLRRLVLAINYQLSTI